jgi:ABC-type transport system involved in multi-copper enzyme maturation permease subunit
VRHLLGADWVRFGGRRDLRILIALVPVVLAIMFVSDFTSVTTRHPPGFSYESSDPVDQAAVLAQMEAEDLANFRQQLATQLPAFAFPASLLKVAGNFGPVVLLAIYLTAALVGGEFEWGTVRTLHLTSSRGRTLAVRVAVVVGLVGLVVALGLLFGAVIPFFLSVEGAPLQHYAGPVPDLLTGVAGRLLVMSPFIAIPVLMAILARSIAFALLLTLLFFAADLAVTGAPFWSTSPAPWVPALTVAGSISRLLDPNALLASIAPIWVSYGALLAWTVVPILAAIARFRKLDISE